MPNKKNWKPEPGNNPIDWKGNLQGYQHGDFEKHPLHIATHPLMLNVLKWCQQKITSAESTVNDEGEVEFSTWPGIESLIDIRKHAMAASAKMAGGLSSENRDAEEVKVSLEFLGMAHAHFSILIHLFRLVLLERSDDKTSKLIVQEFLEQAVTILGSLESHMLKLKAQNWNS